MRECTDMGIAGLDAPRSPWRCRKKPEQIGNRATITTKPISSCSAIRAVADHQVGGRNVAVRQAGMAQLADQQQPAAATWLSTGAAGPARSLQQVDGQSGCPGEVFYPGMLAIDRVVVLIEPALLHQLQGLQPQRVSLSGEAVTMQPVDDEPVHVDPGRALPVAGRLEPAGSERHAG